MYDRNVKSERILTKFHMLDYEYIFDRNAKFHKKILFISMKRSRLRPCIRAHGGHFEHRL